MDEGTDAIEILQGKLYPLKLGYFGVKCRSQKAIDDRMPIKDAIVIEQEFFSRHPVYAAHSSKMGVPYLTKSLNLILVSHI
jgi:dynamin 1-like protein